MSRDIAPVGFRLPPDLKAWLKTQADKNLRSMNAELVARLEQQRQRDRRRRQQQGGQAND